MQGRVGCKEEGGCIGATSGVKIPWLLLPGEHWYVWIPLVPSSRHWVPPVWAIRLSSV